MLSHCTGEETKVLKHLADHLPRTTQSDCGFRAGFTRYPELSVIMHLASRQVCAPETSLCFLHSISWYCVICSGEQVGPGVRSHNFKLQAHGLWKTLGKWPVLHGPLLLCIKRG